MRKALAILLSVLFLCGLTGCGGPKLDTPIDAAKTWTKAMVKADSKLMDQVNRSDFFSYPTHYLMQQANEDGWVGLDHGQFTYEEVGERIVKISHPQMGDSYIEVRQQDGKWYFVSRTSAPRR